MVDLGINALTHTKNIVCFVQMFQDIRNFVALKATILNVQWTPPDGMPGDYGKYEPYFPKKTTIGENICYLDIKAGTCM